MGLNDFHLLYQHLQHLNLNSNFFACYALFIFDYERQKHILLDGPVQQAIGYHPQDFLNGGLSFFRDLFHKDDLVVFNEQCFNKVLSLFSATPKEEHDSFVFELNYRLRNKQGGYNSVLQKARYITDPATNVPKYCFGLCSDISEYKRDARIVQIIHKNTTPNNLQLVARNYFFPNKEESVLTRKEREILGWMIDGLSSKQIAFKAKSSLNTVSNHRKNMLRKTGAKNTADLVRYGIEENII